MQATRQYARCLGVVSECCCFDGALLGSAGGHIRSSDHGPAQPLNLFNGPREEEASLSDSEVSRISAGEYILPRYRLQSLVKNIPYLHCVWLADWLLALLISICSVALFAEMWGVAGWISGGKVARLVCQISSRCNYCQKKHVVRLELLFYESIKNKSYYISFLRNFQWGPFTTLYQSYK